MIEYKHQLKNFKWNRRKEVKRQRKGKKRPRKNTFFIDDILTFDIETTSAWQLEDGSIIPYEVGHTNKWWNKQKPLAIMYIWQFSVNDTVYYGRTWKDFLLLLKDLPGNCKMKIWVHNLSFEYAFLESVLHFDNVFARTPHKPIKASCIEFPNIEFCCSYTLTNMSLESWGKELGLPKMVGDLDYEQIRTPLTELTDTEKGYCQRDCEVVYAGIKDMLTRYQHQWDVPMTSTGQIRRVIKDMLTSDPGYVRWIKKLVPKDAEEYRRALKVFAGGYTHANRIHAGSIIYPEDCKHIGHRDYASSYPFVICSEKFPCGRWTACGRLKIPSDADMEKYAYIMTLKFKNIKSHNFNTYIQNSKARTVHPKIDNGRIMEAEELVITITEQDYITIRNNYNYDSIEVLDMYYCYKDYLPKEFIEYCLQLYNDKTTLKGIEGKEDQYALSKTYINSLYGMMVSAIMYALIVYNASDHSWRIGKQLTTENIEEKLQQLRNWNKYEKRYFLNFWWGVYVTAYARRNLWQCIESFPDEGYDVLYCDTDSIFYNGTHDFTWYDKQADEKLHKMCEHWGIDFELTRPKTPKGISKPLGHFEDENDDIIEFKTLGAKRYCFRSADGELHLTVSGINKSAVNCLNNDLDNFHKGTNFDKDHPDVKKKLHTYVKQQGEVHWPDGYVSTEDYGINIRRTGYELTIPDEYERLMNAFSLDFDIMNDDIINIARRNFI